MNYRNGLTLLFALLLAWPAWGVDFKSGREMVGKSFYNQTNLWAVKGTTVFWANYHMDTLIPVNAEIVVEQLVADQLVFTVKESGQKIMFDNDNRSGMRAFEWAKRQFGLEKVDLSHFTEVEQAAIGRGVVEKGMGKEAIVAAYGYPPKHGTPDMNASHWTYWTNRWNKQIYYFDADAKLASIKD